MSKCLSHLALQRGALILKQEETRTLAPPSPLVPSNPSSAGKWRAWVERVCYVLFRLLELFQLQIQYKPTS